MRRYVLLCALSGACWAGIAWVLCASHAPKTIWGGLVAAPGIGIVVGLAYLPVYRHSRWVRALGALGTLYLAVCLFGLAMGVADALRGIPRSNTEVVFQSVLATLWGVTFTGYVLVLWPLAFANHWLLGRGREAF